MRLAWRTMVVAGIGAVLLLQASEWSRVEAQESTDVAVQAFAFSPTTLTVPAGTTVTWTNLDPVQHTVTDIEQTWDSGLFDPQASYAKTFDTPGMYTYFCLPHPTMIGTVEVTP
jgi:plastocyanin